MGLDTYENRLAKEKEAEEEIDPLNLEFPFKIKGIDLEFFGLLTNEFDMNFMEDKS